MDTTTLNAIIDRVRPVALKADEQLREGLTLHVTTPACVLGIYSAAFISLESHNRKPGETVIPDYFLVAGTDDPVARFRRLLLNRMAELLMDLYGFKFVGHLLFELDGGPWRPADETPRELVAAVEVHGPERYGGSMVVILTDQPCPNLLSETVFPGTGVFVAENVYLPESMLGRGAVDPTFS